VHFFIPPNREVSFEDFGEYKLSLSYTSKFVASQDILWLAKIGHNFILWGG
jgi:hypothetical protein